MFMLDGYHALGKPVFRHSNIQYTVSGLGNEHSTLSQRKSIFRDIE